MSYFLGIDAGGTKTVCALADDHTILARATGGTIKLNRISQEQALHNLQALLQQVCASANIPVSAVSHTCMGLAGLKFPAQGRWTAEALQSLVGDTYSLCEDEAIALDAAFPGMPGVLVISGTGSNVVARGMQNRMHAGGFGPVISDEGSGYWIGRRAVGAALFADQESEQSSPLLQAILQAWQCETRGDLVALANGSPAPNFPVLAPVIHEYALNGDPVAIAVLEDAGRALGRLVITAIERLRRCEPGVALQLGWTGSILEHIAIVRQAMAKTVQETLPELSILAKPADPIDGALWRARNAHCG